MRSYLSDRYEYVQVGNVASSKVLSRYGVPQGSVLGPLLFNVYMNDVAFLPLTVKKLFYADDGVFYCSGSDINSLETRLNDSLQTFYDWLNFNKMKLYLQSKFMIFSLSNPKPACSIKVNNICLESADQFKYLGFYLDPSLTFNKHIDHLCKKFSHRYTRSQLLNQKLHS